MKNFILRNLRLTGVGLTLFFMPSLLRADDPPIPVKPDAVVQPERDKSNNTGPTSPDRVLPGEPPVYKSYWIPALEIPLFQALLNRFDYYFIEPRSDYDVSFQSMHDHVQHGPWVIDQDVFAINQIGHPYQGSMYYSFARSTNLNYWESFIYSNAGSAIWEISGETTKPSWNDQIATGVGGSFLGEALYRLSNLVLENAGKERPGRLRHLAAALISPPTELNRLVFGDRFGPVFESRQPAVMSELHLGAGSNATRDAPGSSAQLERTVPYGAFHLAYGLPGKPGYRYQRPFDYFDIELNSVLEKRKAYPNGMIRGLLFGTPYEVGENYRGVWGLYGSFDYLSPQVYRVSTTAASLGTTGQWWASRRAAVQGTALAGMGFGAAGTILPDAANEADYHYGATPQQLLNLRFLLGQRAMIDLIGRNYYISSLGSSANRAKGTEWLQQGNATLTFRLFGHQAISLGYQVAHRDARYESGIPNRKQLIETVLLTYTILGHSHFRAVEWR